MSAAASLLVLLSALAGQAGPASAPQAPESSWYLERGTERREARPADDVPAVALVLEGLLRDGGVPGFYDGQFAAVAGEFDALARLVQDDSIHAVMRMLAVMALQEAGDGEALAAVLAPLVLTADVELALEREAFEDRGDRVDDEFRRRILAADISRHARFALAKDGQPAWVLAKVEVMRRQVWKRRFTVLDPLVRSFDDLEVAWLRTVWFDIGYHYQQFDDFDNASRWFAMLCDSLGGDETRWAHYNLACMAALRGQPEDALAQLQEAVAAGFLDVGWMQEDGDLASLRGRPEFQALVRELGGEAHPDTAPDAASAGPR